MDKMAAVFSLFLLLMSVSSQADQAPLYATEINSIRERERIVREEGDKQYWANQNAFEHIDQISNVLKEYELAQKPFPLPPKGLPEGASASERLDLISSVMRWAESALYDNKSVTERVDRLFKIADYYAQDVPGLSEKLLIKKIAVLSHLNEMRTGFEKWQAWAKLQEQKWHEWQLSIFRQNQADLNLKALEKLEFDDLIRQLNYFRIGATQALKIAQSKKNIQTLQEIIEALVWMRSQTSVLFFGRISNDLRKASVDEQNTLLEQLISQYQTESVQIESEQLVSDSTQKQIELKSLSEAIYNDEVEPQQIDRFLNFIDHQNSTQIKAKDTPEKPKLIIDIEAPGSIHDYELKRGAFARVEGDQIKDWVPLPKGSELKNQMQDDMRKVSDIAFGGTPQVSPQPKDRGPLKEKMDRMCQMAESAFNQSPSGPSKDELSRIKDEIKKLRDLETRYREENQSWLQHSSQALETGLTSVSKSKSQIPSEVKGQAGVIPDHTSSDESKALMIKCALEIGDFVIGFTPAGNAYNLGSFVLAMSTDKTPTGDEATPTVKALLGIGVILPFVPGVARAAKAVKVVNQAARGSQKLTGVLPKLSRYHSMMKGYNRLTKAGGEKAISKLAAKSGEDASKVLMAAEKAKEIIIYTREQAEELVRKAMDILSENYQKCFKEGEDVIFMELGEGGLEGKGFKFSDKSTGKIDGHFAATRDPRSYESIDKYFNEFAVPGDKRVGNVVERGYEKGDSIFIGEVGGNVWGEGGGTQIFTPGKGIGLWEKAK